MDVANELLDAIEIIVDKKIRENTAQIYFGVCKGVNGDSCVMSINGKNNTIHFYGSAPIVGLTYRVFVPNGNMSMAFAITGNDDRKGLYYSNPNFLDNWHFGNPVNQRGQTEYNGISTIQYSIDRWLAHRSVVSLVDGGVKVGSAGTAISNLGFQTSIENPAYLVGKEVTMSVLLESNEATEIIYFGVFYGAGASNQTAWGIRSAAIPAGGVGLYSVTAVLPDMGTYKAMNPVIRVQGSQSGGFTIKAAKLELGTQQTLAHQNADGNWVLNEIPDYGEQLLRCQRYFQTFATESLRPTDALDFRPVMRTNPALSTIAVGGKTLYTASADL